jgi:hypothetical protein
MKIPRLFSRLSISVLPGLCLLFTCGEEKSPTAANQDPYAALAVQCVNKINAYRASIGMGPLIHAVDKDACTGLQAQQDSQTDRAHGAFGQCGESAQNECPGWGSEQAICDGCLQSMWDEGPGEPYSAHGHYINMTNSRYTQVSCGFYTTGSGEVWAVFNFY